MFDIEDYFYELPQELIAQYPAQKRSESRLFVLGPQDKKAHTKFSNIIEYINENDLLVLNNTKVVPARVFAQKPTGGKVELLVLKEIAPHQVRAMFRTHRGLRPGLILRPLNKDGSVSEHVQLEVIERSDNGTVLVQHPFDSWLQLLELFGHVALPPYIKRKDAEEDFLRYQTVYAKKEGAVAAPTAGLHFDQELLGKLKLKGVKMAYVTLHVGPGTFKPVRVDDIREHQVDPEWVEVPQDTVDQILETQKRGGRVIAVGTTTVKSLESAALEGELKPFNGPTSLYILPGHCFKVVDMMITNFHLPKSSLLILVSAFAGRERIITAYKEAVSLKYHFFSYGDAMLLYPIPEAINCRNS